jgi:type I restriction enzyme S subunit
MPKIDQGALGATVIPMPSIERQKFALAELDHLEYVQSRIDTAATSALARSAALRRAVLSAAFDGRLTGRHTDQEVIEELAAV